MTHSYGDSVSFDLYGNDGLFGPYSDGDSSGPYGNCDSADPFDNSDLFDTSSDGKITDESNISIDLGLFGMKEFEKTSRSSYYEKYGPTSSFTKATINTKKITSVFKIGNQATIIRPDEIEQISSNSEDEIINKDTYQIDKKNMKSKRTIRKAI
ncbi:18130_t:CDS:2 [Funneliformis geosporum]|nr:18130_t:CDS:2 [Funneliformis geosporum]